MRKEIKYLNVASAYLPPGKASGGSQSEALILLAAQALKEALDKLLAILVPAVVNSLSKGGVYALNVVLLMGLVHARRRPTVGQTNGLHKAARGLVDETKLGTI